MGIIGSLLRNAQDGSGGGRGRRLGFLHKVAVVPEVAVEESGELGGAGAEGGASAFEEEDGDDASVLGVGIGGEPAVAGAVVGASSGLAHDGKLVEVGAQAAGCTVDRCRVHAVLNFGDDGGDVEGAFY